MDQARIIAVFDFDNTLIEGDSFLPFLAYANGWPRTLLALAEAALRLPFYLGKHDHPRTFFKAILLQRLVAGKSPDFLKPATLELRAWQKWIEPVKRLLLDHHAKGHHVVVASGSLDIYLPALLEGLPHHAVICTEIGLRDGVYDGAMVNGNCVRERKAELVKAYMEEHGPFEDSFGYGNFPYDLPMLELVKQRTII